MNLRDLHVRKGDPVLPAWLKLLEWAKQFRLIAGRGIRLTRTPNGTYIVAEAAASGWNHPFKVFLGDQSITVLLGTVNARAPTLNGRPLDDDPVPALRLRKGPNRELRSWLSVEAEVDAASGVIDPMRNDAIRIVHSREIPASSGLIGQHALAMLVWKADRASVRRVHQISHFNLQHRFTPARTGVPSRHLFWPA